MPRLEESRHGIGKFRIVQREPRRPDVQFWSRWKRRFAELRWHVKRTWQHRDHTFRHFKEYIDTTRVRGDLENCRHFVGWTFQKLAPLKAALFQAVPSLKAPSIQPIKILARKARLPLAVFTGFALLLSLAFILAILFPVGYLQKSAPNGFRPASLPTTIDADAADSPSKLAVHRMTSLGRLKLDQETRTRLTSDLSQTNARIYVQTRVMLLQSLTAQIEADAVLFDEEFARKSCAPAAELRLASTMWEQHSFQESHIFRHLHLSGSSPVGELLISDYNSSDKAIKKLQLGTLFRVADSALAVNCFDLAHQLYTKVVPIAFSIEEMQRAHMGIQGAIARRAKSLN